MARNQNDKDGVEREVKSSARSILEMITHVGQQQIKSNDIQSKHFEMMENLLRMLQQTSAKIDNMRDIISKLCSSLRASDNDSLMNQDMCHEEDKTKFKSSERSVPAGTCFGTPLQSCVNMADSDNTNQNQPPTRIMESAQPISEMQLEQLQTSQREEEFQQDFDDFVTQNAGNVEELRSAYDNMSVEQFQQLQGSSMQGFLGFVLDDLRGANAASGTPLQALAFLVQVTSKFPQIFKQHSGKASKLSRQLYSALLSIDVTEVDDDLRHAMHRVSSFFAKIMMK